jgi:hypothetical protein
MNSRIPLYLLITLFVFGCNNSSVISYKSDTSAPENHVRFVDYCLPKSVLKIKVPIVKSTMKKGLIDSLTATERTSALKYFSINYGWKEVKTPKAFSLGKKIQFIPLTEPDMNKCYSLAYKNKKTLSQNLGLSLTKDGIISSGEFAQENKTFEYVSKAIELSATITSKLYALGGDEDMVDMEDIGDSNAAKRIKVLRSELKKLKEAKNNMIIQRSAGSVKDVLEYRMSFIDKRIAAIKSEVMGYHKKTTYWLSFLYEPAEVGDVQKKIILVLDNVNGLSIPRNPLFDLSYINQGSTISKAKKLEIRAAKLNSVPVQSTTVNGSKESEAFLFYNVPAKYSIQLFYDGKPLKSFKSSEDKKGNDIYTMYFPQRGVVNSLPADFKESSITYYEDIGAIKTVKFKREATLTSERLGMAAAAADSLRVLRDARKAFLEAKNSDESEDETEEVEETIIRLIIEDGDIPK